MHRKGNNKLKRRIIFALIYLSICALVFAVLFRCFAPSRGRATEDFAYDKQVSVYFAKKNESACPSIVPQSVTVTNAETLVPEALVALVNGPESSDHADIYSAVSGATINSVEVADGTAYVDLGGSFLADQDECGERTAKMQIRKTMERLDDVDDVVLTIDGGRIALE